MDIIKAVVAIVCAAILFIPIFIFQCIRVVVLGVLNIFGVGLMARNRRKYGDNE